MSLSITPKLNIKDSEDFLKRIEKDLKNKVGLIPTPRLEKAEKAVRCFLRRKCIHIVK